MRAWGLLLILLPALVMTACPVGGGASHELPADWPISQLTIDPDWQLRREVAAMHKLDPAQNPDPQWIVIFDKGGDWPGVVSHVESCLEPLGWLRSKSKGLNNPLGLDLPETRQYYSPDYLTEVYMTNGCYFDVLIDIDVEFALQVTKYSQPPELIQGALNHQKRDPKLTEALLDAILEPIT
jgi:hypothetical protein